MAYTNLNNGTWRSKRSGLHSSADQSAYSQWSSALGQNYNVGEYVPYYHNSYVTSSAAGRAQMAADRAEAQNIARYYEILAGYRGLLDSGVSQVGTAYDRALASNLQSLTSRGLTGTSVLTNAANRNALSKAAAQRATYDGNLLQMLQFMERRNDSYSGGNL